ncbi:hypothetical protein ACFVFP_41495, partial [Streptomyces sp. NPDC057686]
MALRIIRPAGPEVYQAADGRPELPECWLLAGWPAGWSQPGQFWLSDLLVYTALTTLVRLAKLRWRIKRPSHLGGWVGCRSWRGLLSGLCRMSCGRCS